MNGAQHYEMGERLMIRAQELSVHPDRKAGWIAMHTRLLMEADTHFQAALVAATIDVAESGTKQWPDLLRPWTAAFRRPWER